ncbi:MAG: thiamine pyrophosphate-dependent enzyme [archaeon]|nr:thiamine pyrophosphate-dependent enzyme [archaeon]
MEDIELAKNMIKIRLSQLIVNEKYKNKEFKIPIHLALGHESIAVAVDSIMDEKDKLILNHRNIHYNLAREKSLKYILKEYQLSKDGIAGGELGSMNLANEEKGIIYTSSILGNNLPVAAGVSLSKKVKQEGGIVTVVTGDGAMEEGTFYETLLFLKSNNLPCLVIVENNEWSLATKIDERRCNIDIGKFAESLAIKYISLDSNNPFEYARALKDLKEYSLINKTPVCIEVKLSTLGDLIKKTDEFPNGKFINYHAGPASTINLSNGPIIEKTDKDPVFVISNYLGEEIIENLSKELLNEINREIE